MKVAVIGIDGGSFETIKKALKNNELPFLKKMINEGFSSKLIVPTPPVTIPSWPCLFSGITPYQLGFYWFSHHKKGIFNSNYWREKALFSIPEIKSFVLNVPGTYPAWVINGEMITGMLSPSFSCYPEHLSEKYSKEWIIDAKTVESIFEAFHMKSKLFLKKIDQDFNLYIYVIRMPDAISHIAHKGIKKTMKDIIQSYKKIDDFLARLYKKKEIDNIFIVSDHGMSLYFKEFNLYRFFEREKILSINDIKFKLLKSISLKLFDILRPILSERLILKLKHWIKKKKKDDQNITPENEFKPISEEKTDIKGFVSNIGGIFLRGTDKEKKDNMLHLLSSNSSVKKIIEPKIDGFPDAYIILQDHLIFGDKPSPLLYRRRNMINHSKEGLFIAYGKNIKKGGVKSFSYLDVAPTILKLFNIKQSKSMIGKVIDSVVIEGKK